MSRGNNKKYKPTEKGFKEEDEDIKETVPTKAEEKEIEKLVEKKEEKKKETTEGVKLENKDNLSIPYSDLGYTVSQLSGFPQAKRIACIGVEKNKEFEKKYHI